MVSIPLTILDNFLDNPQNIKDWGLSLPFEPIEEMAAYPGSRSPLLDDISPIFNKFYSRKILSLFYNQIPTSYRAYTVFQLIEDYEDTGWIHQDSPHTFFTSILYLTEETDTDCGTSLYELNSTKHFPINSSQDFNLVSNATNNHHITKKLTPQESINKKSWEKANFTKIHNIKDKFNRLICFPADSFHSANNLSPKNKSPRLTLITFFSKIESPELPPIIRSKLIPHF